ncbi:uncharacterized protein LOC109860395, partial [Pseudomyrmex gracilis]|uniref:uncharacterized protein LOC109860395 n=1 Tax=Pseudomyrmex gracilis TaxID=219809 RepID=UPI000994B58A
IIFSDVISLIIPEELPTLLSLIYSNIPPIKKGTDSRLGVGFRLGEHADFQILIELGPQTETESLSASNDAKRRRDTITAAMRGELGPLTQAIAKYQIQQAIKKEVEKYRIMQEKLKKVQMEEKKQPENQHNTSSNWLTEWRKEMSYPSQYDVSLNLAQNDTIQQQRIERPLVQSNVQKNKFEELAELYRSQNTTRNT